MQFSPHAVPAAFAPQDDYAHLMSNRASQRSTLFHAPTYAQPGFGSRNIGPGADYKHTHSHTAADGSSPNTDYGTFGPCAGYDFPTIPSAPAGACPNSDWGTFGPQTGYDLRSCQAAADGAFPNSPASVRTPIDPHLFSRFYEMAVQRLAERDPFDPPWLWDSLDEEEQPGSAAVKGNHPTVEDIAESFLNDLRSVPSNASTASLASRGWDVPEGSLPEASLLEGSVPEGLVPEGLLPEGSGPHAQQRLSQLHRDTRMDTASSGFGSAEGSVNTLSSGRKRKADPDAICSNEQDVEYDSLVVAVLEDAALMSAVVSNSPIAANAMQNMQPGTMLSTAHVQMIVDELLAADGYITQPVKKRKTGRSSSSSRAMHRVKGGQHRPAAAMPPRAVSEPHHESNPNMHALGSHPDPHQTMTPALGGNSDPSQFEQGALHKHAYAAASGYPQAALDATPTVPG